MDFLTALKTITKSIKEWAEDKFFNKDNIDSSLNEHSQNPVQNRVINTAINSLKTMIGEVDVSAQINKALKDATASDFGIYVQATEPSGASNGDIWIDTSSDPSVIDIDAPVKSVNGQTGDVNITAINVGADASGTAEYKVSSHNTNTSSHNDIRVELQNLANKINAFLDSDDTTLDELSELITAIKNNKTTIGQLTSGKVNVTDIINDLTTNVSNKPLSAAQGVALKALIDAISKSEVGLENVDNVKQYSAVNPPPYPVTSVNNKTGKVTISELPAVTTSDNGKVLMVVNGAWKVVDLNMTIDANGVVSV